MSIEKRVQVITNTPTIYLGKEFNNNLYMKREDMIPYSFGGNKARKGFLFFEEIDKGDYDCVVTYGSSHSNHCRIIANLAAERRIPCIIIGPKEVSDETFNTKLMKLFGAQILTVPVNLVHDTITNKMDELRNNGKNPRGRNVVLDSIREYMPDVDERELQERTIFLDQYIGNGYGKENVEIENTIKECMLRYGIPMDSTYTAKAFLGMKKYLQKEVICEKNVLFIHTGGTPLFFDDFCKVELN